MPRKPLSPGRLLAFYNRHGYHYDPAIDRIGDVPVDDLDADSDPEEEGDLWDRIIRALDAGEEL